MLNAPAATELKDNEIYELALKEFSEPELAQLTLAIVPINGWNRFNVAFRMPSGNYKSPHIRKTG